jgi:hypothetical protein
MPEALDIQSFTVISMALKWGIKAYITVTIHVSSGE